MSHRAVIVVASAGLLAACSGYADTPDTPDGPVVGTVLPSQEPGTPATPVPPGATMEPPLPTSSA